MVENKEGGFNEISKSISAKTFISEATEAELTYLLDISEKRLVELADISGPEARDEELAMLTVKELSIEERRHRSSNMSTEVKSDKRNNSGLINQNRN